MSILEKKMESIEDASLNLLIKDDFRLFIQSEECEYLS